MTISAKTKKNYSSSKDIEIKGARLHNLKNIDVKIPRNKFVVITGLSGSGKSSLAFDTLFTEGQRRYVESLSSYARQFLGKLDKPKVDKILGISPTIAIKQNIKISNPRSTIGTSTEIYDYLKLIYARIGKTYDDKGQIVKKHTTKDVLEYISKFPKKEKLLLLVPITPFPNKKTSETLKILYQQGYARIITNDNKTLNINDINSDFNEDFKLIIDRIAVNDTEEFINRTADSIETAFYEGHGQCIIHHHETGKEVEFNNRFESEGKKFIEPSLHFFSFNNPLGACPKCEGYGNISGIDPNLVIPNQNLSVYNKAIQIWKGKKMSNYLKTFLTQSHKFDFPVHTPWFELSKTQQNILWKGNKYFTGLNKLFKNLEAESYKIQNRVMLSKYRGRTICDACEGSRLREETKNVKIAGKTINELVDLPIYQFIKFFKKEISLNKYDTKIAEKPIKEIIKRSQYLIDVGLEYLTINRKSNTLSGGESQRIKLASSLGNSLVSTIYVLDEPSVGLHSKDTKRLIKILKLLRDIGNTVVVVEHDEDIIREADHIIDIGPKAGAYGGELVAEGSLKEILKTNTLTAQYLNQTKKIAVPYKRRKFSDMITLQGVRRHNLQNVEVSFPLNILTVITGVSGSGKSSLIKDVLLPKMTQILENIPLKEDSTKIYGAYNKISQVKYIDQNPIGRSSRSNPVTYIKAFDDIRALFASQKTSNINDYTIKHFSLNVANAGRCETCKGEGKIIVEMQFMADVNLVCEDCKGNRFKKEILEVRFQGKNIADILELSIDEAILFFRKYEQNSIVNKLLLLQDVGMGYVSLGQPSNTLSAGEAQRIKLASFLSKGKTKEHILFILDEPTMGLHFHDIAKLINVLNSLIDKGHSVIVIEHNMDLIKCADYIIDIGPKGGDKGGRIIAKGTPEQIMKNKNSTVFNFLNKKLQL